MASKWNTSAKSTGGKKVFSFSEFGYLPDGDAAPKAYLARITSIRNKWSVVGLLQEDIQMRVESRWDPFIPASMLAKGNMLLQLVSSALPGVSGGPKSLVTKAASRRLWVGTTPMTLNLKLRFEAINDSYKDVVEPCKILQSLALPSEPSTELSGDEIKNLSAEIRANPMSGSVKLLKSLPLLSPPGPSPFSWEGILSSRKPVNELNLSSIVEGTKGGDRIMLQLGQFLNFDDVIIREVSTNFHIKMDMFGDPISADVNVILETYEIPTVQTLSRAYKKVSLMRTSTETEIGPIEFHRTTFR